MLEEALLPSISIVLTLNRLMQILEAYMINLDQLVMECP